MAIGPPTNVKLAWEAGIARLTWDAVPNATAYVVKKGRAEAQLEVIGTPTVTDWEIAAPSEAKGWTLRATVAAKQGEETGPDSSPAASTDIPPTVPLPEIERVVWIVALIVTALGVVAAKWFIDTALPLRAAYEVTGVTDTAATAFGHRLLMIIAQSAVQMISWGIALLLAIFVPISVAAALSSVKFREKAPQTQTTTTTTTRTLVGGSQQTEVVTIGGIDVAGFFKSVSDMLKVPAGFGGLLVALGTLLLVVGLSSQAAGAGPTPSPSPSGSPEPSASGSPGPSSAPIESAVPSGSTTPSLNPSAAPTATGG